MEKGGSWLRLAALAVLVVHCFGASNTQAVQPQILLQKLGASLLNKVNEDMKSFADGVSKGFEGPFKSSVTDGGKAFEDMIKSALSGVNAKNSNESQTQFYNAGQQLSSLMRNLAGGFSGMNESTDVRDGLRHMREVTETIIVRMNASSFAQTDLVKVLLQLDNILKDTESAAESVAQLIEAVQAVIEENVTVSDFLIEVQKIASPYLKETTQAASFNRTLQFLSRPSTVGALSRLSHLLRNNSNGLPTSGQILQALAGNVPFESLVSQTLTSLQPNLTLTCQADIVQFVMQLTQGAFWSLSMLDATGKLEPTIMQGNLEMRGNYDECREIDVAVPASGGAPSRHIKGGYYIVNIAVDKKIIPDSMGMMKYIPNIVIRWHVCLPRSCDVNNLNALFANRSLVDGVNVSSIETRTAHFLTADDHPAIATLVILGILILLVVVGTTYDVVLLYLEKKGKDKEEDKGQAAREHRGLANPGFSAIEETSQKPGLQDMDGDAGPNGVHLISKVDINGSGSELDKAEGGRNGRVWTSTGKLGPRLEYTYTQSPAVRNPALEKKPSRCLQALRGVLLSFSLRINTTKLFRMQHSAGSLTALNGIRVLSMAWVVYGHTMSFVINYSQNMMSAYKLTQDFFMQIMLNATYSVDSFFVLSGFLVAYLFLKESEKQGNKVSCKQMVYYYVHRYWRLTPTMIAAIMVSGFLGKYLFEGPNWSIQGTDPNCKDNWWTNALYINNFVTIDKVCWGAGWYLANDMQFYVISPLILVPMVYGFYWIGYLLCFLLVVTQIASSWAIYHANNFSLLDPETQGDMMNLYYVKPYCRVGVYAIGLALGAFLHQKKMKFKLQRMSTVLGWLVALALMFTVSVVTYDSNKNLASKWSVDINSAFNALNRPAWGLVIAWIIFACTTGHGGFINSLLSWPGWLPFGRLSYGVYLLHITVLGAALGNMRVKYYYTIVNTIYDCLGYLVASFASSYVLSLLVESPSIGLEAVLLGKKRKRV